MNNVAAVSSSASKPVWSDVHFPMTLTVAPRCNGGSRLPTSWYELESAVGPNDMSSGVMRSRSAMQWHARMVGSCARHAPFGLPVVPDV